MLYVNRSCQWASVSHMCVYSWQSVPYCYYTAGAVQCGAPTEQWRILWHLISYLISHLISLKNSKHWNHGREHYPSSQTSVSKLNVCLLLNEHNNKFNHPLQGHQHSERNTSSYFTICSLLGSTSLIHLFFVPFWSHTNIIVYFLCLYFYLFIQHRCDALWNAAGGCWWTTEHEANPQQACSRLLMLIQPLESRS